MNDDRRSSVGEQGHDDDVDHTVNTDSDANDSDLAAEYESSRDERGKHALAMRAGYSMVIHRSDGTTETRELTPRPGNVVLDPDVRVYFPDSDAVNRALRGLISLLPPHSTPTESR